MGTSNYSDEFKRDAVHQITVRGYAVREVSGRLGVSTHSLYAWKRKFTMAVSGDTEKDAEIRRLKRELVRVSEECDILKKSHRIFRSGCKVSGASEAPSVRARWRRRSWPSIGVSLLCGRCVVACASSRAGSMHG